MLLPTISYLHNMKNKLLLLILPQTRVITPLQLFRCASDEHFLSFFTCEKRNNAISRFLAPHSRITYLRRWRRRLQQHAANKWAAARGRRRRRGGAAPSVAADDAFFFCEATDGGGRAGANHGQLRAGGSTTTTRAAWVARGARLRRGPGAPHTRRGVGPTL